MGRSFKEALAQWYSPSEKYLSWFLLGAMAQRYSLLKSIVDVYFWDLWPNGTVPQNKIYVAFYKELWAQWYCPSKKYWRSFSLRAVAQWYSPSEKYLSCFLLGAMAQRYSLLKSIVDV